MPDTPILRRLARLEAETDLPDGSGGFSKGWTPIAEHWVALTPASGSESYEGSQQASRVTHRIRLRATRALRPRADQRFTIGTRTYDIRAVFDRDGRGRFLTCLCEESP